LQSGKFGSFKKKSQQREIEHLFKECMDEVIQDVHMCCAEEAPDQHASHTNANVNQHDKMS
jgi:hypothetical protein